MGIPYLERKLVQQWSHRCSIMMNTFYSPVQSQSAKVLGNHLNQWHLIHGNTLKYNTTIPYKRPGPWTCHTDPNCPMIFSSWLRYFSFYPTNHKATKFYVYITKLVKKIPSAVWPNYAINLHFWLCLAYFNQHVYEIYTAYCINIHNYSISGHCWIVCLYLYSLPVV